MSKKNTTVYTEVKIIDNLPALAKKEERSSNYYYDKWIKEGFKKDFGEKK